MKGLKIAEDLMLPADLITDTIGILSIRGSGKTYTFLALVEEMVKESLPVAIVDTMGVCWGLRSSADGKSPGLPVVILGGEHGDVPLESTAGKVIADWIMSERQPAVLDISEFSKNEALRFVLDFVTRLFQCNRDPIHLMIDEADEWCLSDDTELLTNQGWMNHRNIIPGETVASCFDINTRKYVWGLVERLIVHEYEGEMINLKTRRIDCLITPEHRSVIRRQQRAKGRYRSHSYYDWTFCVANNIPTQIEIPAGASPCGIGIPNLSDDILRILGWIITDGCYHDRRKSIILRLDQSVSTKKRGIYIAAEMEKLLSKYWGIKRYDRPARNRERNGRKLNVHPSVSWYLGKKLSEELNKWLAGDIHQIPRCILNECSERQLRILYDGLLEGDGTSMKGKWRCFYAGKNESLADQFQELCSRLRICTVKGIDRDGGDYHINIENYRFNHYIRRPKRKHYKGIIWDITVPTGAFVARRNGRTFVTGNCPQRPFREEARTLRAFEVLVRRGRARGIGATLVTQRPATLNKNVLTQVGTLIVGRMIAPQDRKAIQAWIDAHGTERQKEEFWDSLASLSTKEKWVWSPSRDIFKRVLIRKRKTFDSSRTPEVGEKHIAPKSIAEVDLEGLRGRIAATIERVKQEDPRELRRQISELKRQLQGRKEIVTKEKEVEIKVPVFKKGEVAGVNRAIDKLLRINEKVSGLCDDLTPKVRDMKTSMDNWLNKSSSTRVTAPQRILDSKLFDKVEVKEPIRKELVGRVAIIGIDDANLRLGERRMIEVLIRWHPAVLTKAQLATLSRLRVSSGTFSAYYGTLKRWGMIEERLNGITVSEIGLRQCRAVKDVPQTTEEIVEMWRSALRLGERKLLDILIDAYPQSVSRGDLAEQAGLTANAGTFSAYLGTLRRNGLAEVKDEHIRAGEALFLSSKM